MAATVALEAQATSPPPPLGRGEVHGIGEGWVYIYIYLSLFLTSLNRSNVSRYNVVIAWSDSRYNINIFNMDITCRYKGVVITWSL